jgi:ABC-2 type transport system permease protein
MLRLLQNETLKVQRRGRFAFVLAILALFAVVSSWAQYRQAQNRAAEEPGASWQARTARRVLELEKQVDQRRIFAGFTRFLRFEIQRLDYHLERDIDPDALTGPVAVRSFALLASTLLIPLLVAVLTADLVSFENSSGAIKLLLTKPISRLRILLSKALAMALFTTLTVLTAGLFVWLVGGLFFGFAGWNAPTLAGLRAGADGVNITDVRISPLWLETTASYGLLWLAALAVGCVALLISVLFRSAAGALGTLFSILVGGVLLAQLAADFQPAKWFFVTSLALPQYHAGVPPPVSGMSLGFCVAVLAVWGLGSLWLAAYLFCRRDVTVGRA